MMKHDYFQRPYPPKRAWVVMAMIVFCMLALPALATEDHSLCPVCTKGWVRTWQVPISYTTLEMQRCTHGDSEGSDRHAEVQYQDVLTCTHCGAVKAGEPYTVEEFFCSRDLHSIAAIETRTPQLTASPLSLTEDLAAQAQAVGLQSDEQFVAEHNGTLYLVQYAPPVTDWDTWNSTGAGNLFPRTLGDAVWKQGTRDAELDGSGLMNDWVIYRPVHDWENWLVGTVVEHDLPAATLSATYERADIPAFTLTLRRAVASDMIGEMYTQGSVTLYRQYTHDGTLRRIWWQDDETGVVLELHPHAFTADQSSIVLAELVNTGAEAYMAWASV